MKTIIDWLCKICQNSLFNISGTICEIIKEKGMGKCRSCDNFLTKVRIYTKGR